MEYPKILYVEDQMLYRYLYFEQKELIGKDSFDALIPDDGKEHSVAVYQLVEVATVKKTTTRTSVVEKVEERKF